ncbi:MAG: NAD(+) synthase [Paludibacteraceae bacterium]|nr:NAD(+) synthase [Paludibacteraceae bacterium]
MCIPEKIKIALAVPLVRVADVDFNVLQIENLIQEATDAGARIVVFPELSITGATCGDLFLHHLLVEKAHEGLKKLVNSTKSLDIVAVVGLPFALDNGLLYNVAVVFHKGDILGVVPKNVLSYKDKRWFSEVQTIRTIDCLGKDVPFGKDFFDSYDVTFSVGVGNVSVKNANLIFQISAQPTTINIDSFSFVGKTTAPLITLSSGFGESSTDGAFGGEITISKEGKVLFNKMLASTKNEIFVTEIDIEHTPINDETTQCIVEKDEELLEKNLKPFPFIDEQNLFSQCEKSLTIQHLGLATRLNRIGCKKVIVGISGGLDSTLALLVCARAFDFLNIDRKGIIAITMPGFGTTGRTYQNALNLVRNIGATLKEIDIKKACLQHFEDIGHDKNIHDVTYENTQARERTQILMDVANKENGLVVGTGDMSELALGWATYNGDQMSMYGVNAGVPKTFIKPLVKHVAEQSNGELKRILLDIVDTPISPELIPADEKGNIKQKTEDLVGPYELHDFFMYYFLSYQLPPKTILKFAKKVFDEKYDETEIVKWLKTFIYRFFSQQYKRSCMPDGPKVFNISLSPREDLNLPSDAYFNLWLNDLEE